jgi:hypothetical protein
MFRYPARVKMPETLKPIWNQTTISHRLARNFTVPVSHNRTKSLVYHREQRKATQASSAASSASRGETEGWCNV